MLRPLEPFLSIVRGRWAIFRFRVDVIMKACFELYQILKRPLSILKFQLKDKSAIENCSYKLNILLFLQMIDSVVHRY